MRDGGQVALVGGVVEGAGPAGRVEDAGDVDVLVVAARGDVTRRVDLDGLREGELLVTGEQVAETTRERMKAFVNAKNGFELAEYDLEFRGAGELTGNRQWGISDIGMEAIKNMKMVEAARTEAVRLIEEDPELLNYPLLKNKVREKAGEFHFE